MKPFALFALVAAALASACTTDDYLRTEGVTPGAGNAIAANTVMQMVDPWPPGVEDTDLSVPAERPAPQAASSAEGGETGVTGDK